MVETGSNVETWKNDTAGYVGLRRFDHRGEFTRSELIEGGRTFHISPEERRLNSENAANEEQDFFKNGRLTPVRLIEDSEDAREIAENPNVLSETDMKTLLKAQWKQFENRVSAIRNPGTLERLLTLAHAEDATIRKVETIKARLEEVAPSFLNSSSMPVQEMNAGRVMAHPVTPR